MKNNNLLGYISAFWNIILATFGVQVGAIPLYTTPEVPAFTDN